MERLRYCERGIKWIKECIKSTIILILVNESLTDLHIFFFLKNLHLLNAVKIGKRNANDTLFFREDKMQNVFYKCITNGR